MSPGSTRLAAAATPADVTDTLPARWPEEEGVCTLGFHALHWMQGAEWDWKRAELVQRWPGLVQPNGPRSGRTFRPTARQIRFLLWFYAVDDNGDWLYSHAVRRLAKGSGKSPFAAVHALIEFLAPVRLRGFDDRVPGGCVGQPVEMPWVQIAATAESQTKNTMRMVRAFAPKNSAVVSEFGLDPGKQTYYKLPEGTLEVITSSSTAAEGAESTFVVGDERELWTPNNGGVDFAATLEDNLAKSGARMLGTENSWVPGRESVAESAWDAWLAQTEGRARGETRILYDAVLAAPDTDMSDPAKLRSELERVYADCDWKKPHGGDGEPLVDEPPDVRAIMERIWSPQARPDDSKRKYLNWPTVARDSWVAPEEWNRLADPSTVVADGDEVALFFDGSKSRDATALLGCRIDDGHVFTAGVWEPDPNDPNETVDASDVDRVVAQTFERLDVVAFFADVKEWESYALTEWPQRHKDGLKVWAAPKSRPPQPVAWDMRGHAYEFAKATEAAHREIVEGAFTHDGDARVARHVANARRRPYRDAIAIGKESQDSPRKIDAAVCVVGVRMVRRMVLGSKKRRKSTGEAVFA